MRSDWRIHPDLAALDNILSETYGLPVYQEQIMAILAEVAGWSYGEAGLLFDALRKKNESKMEATKPAFFASGNSRGYSEAALLALWEALLPWSQYGFNRSHSVGYSLIAFHTAYLKAHHPREYMAALLSNEPDNNKLSEYLRETTRMGIPLLPPDINDSNSTFTPTEDGIRYGLEAIKGVGKTAVNDIISRRPYRSLSDYLLRAPSAGINSGTASALSRAGAFDSISGYREGVVETIEAHCEKASSVRKAKKGGQRGVVKPSFRVPQLPADLQLRKAWERELLGTELTAGRIYIRPMSPLGYSEMEWIHQTVTCYAGHQQLVLDLDYTEVELGMTRSDVIGALRQLGKIEVEEV